MKWKAMAAMGIALVTQLLALSSASARGSFLSQGCSSHEIRDWSIRNRIGKQFAIEYPPVAIRLVQDGRLVVAVDTDPVGNLLGARLLSSSGHKELDEGVLAQIEHLKGSLKLTLPGCAPAAGKFSFDIPLRFTHHDSAASSGLPPSHPPAPPASREQVLDLLKSSGAWGDIMPDAPKLTHQIFSMLRQRYPDVPTETVDIISEAVQATLQKEMDENNVYVERLIGLYQRNFTEEDIRLLMMFNRTSLGMKLARVMPELMLEAYKIGQQMGESLFSLIADRANARLKERGYAYEIPAPGVVNKLPANSGRSSAFLPL